MRKIEKSNKVLTSAIKKYYTYLFLCVLFFVLIAPVNTMAQGGLLVTPRRVILDGNNKMQRINLANTGDDSATFVVSYVQYRMTANGEFEQITEPDSGQYFANDKLRLFPRRVTLAPHEAQLVKVQLKNYNKLQDGEYRSHIYFRSENNKPKALGEEEQPADTTTLSVRLVAVFGISIPAIIRKGELAVNVNLSNLKLEMVNDTIPRLNITFNRIGDMSVYGDIEVDYVSPDDEKTRVGLVRGMAVYTPNLFRNFSVFLNKDIDYSSGKLNIVYKSNSDLKPIIYAEDELLLE